MNALLAYLRRVWGYADTASPVPVVALGAAAMLVVQVVARPIHDVDIFWQLKFGELMLSHGLPPTEPFLANRQSEPHVPIAWLAQAAYAGVRQFGGWPLLRLVDAVLWFAGFGLVAVALARTASNRWPVAVGLWVGWIAAVPFASVRPQSFAALAFGLLVLLVRANRSARATVLLGGPLLLVWQNLHPSAAAGGLYLGAAAVAELVLWRRKRGPVPWRLLALLPVAAVVPAATPGGIDALRLMAYNAEICRHLGINEWLPMTASASGVGRDQGWTAVLLTLLLIVVRWRHLRLADVLPLLAFTLSALAAQRFIVFWGIAVIPVWAAAFTRLDCPPVRVKWLVPTLLMTGATVGSAVAVPTRFAEGMPFRGLTALEPVNGTVYTCYLWGGLVTDYGHPHRHPTHDGRYYLFTREQWNEYGAASSGNVPVDELTTRFRPAAFFLRPGSDDGLITNLRRHSGWAEVFADEAAAVFVRR